MPNVFQDRFLKMASPGATRQHAKSQISENGFPRQGRLDNTQRNTQYGNTENAENIHIYTPGKRNTPPPHPTSPTHPMLGGGMGWGGGGGVFGLPGVYICIYVYLRILRIAKSQIPEIGFPRQGRLDSTQKVRFLKMASRGRGD